MSCMSCISRIDAGGTDRVSGHCSSCLGNLTFSVTFLFRAIASRTPVTRKLGSDSTEVVGDRRFCCNDLCKHNHVDLYDLLPSSATPFNTQKYSISEITRSNPFKLHQNSSTSTQRVRLRATRSRTVSTLPSWLTPRALSTRTSSRYPSWDQSLSMWDVRRTGYQLSRKGDRLTFAARSPPHSLLRQQDPLDSSIFDLCDCDGYMHRSTASPRCCQGVPKADRRGAGERSPTFGSISARRECRTQGLVLRGLAW